MKNKELTPPVAVYAKKQTNGIGSRGNGWIGEDGNLFLSFALNRSQLPNDLKIESASIYFSYIMKEILQQMGSQVWIKWPNDFYIGEKKAGGAITNLIGETLVCGIGLNLVSAPKGFAKIDIDVTPDVIVEKFVKKLVKNISWKQVFRKYSVEFYKNKFFSAHLGAKKVSMENAVLQNDGSLMIDGERVYSLR